MNRPALLTLALVAPATSTLAQSSDVDPNHKFSWSENCGWMNWRDANNAADGVRLEPTYLAGHVWCENIGWLNVGDGTPGLGDRYANQTGADFGVNLDPPTGHLSGYAWSENAGWINFSGGALATPPQPARYDTSARRVRGYAWGENIGWINLDDATHYVGITPPCPADMNGDGNLNVFDFLAFQSAFSNEDPAADFDDNGFFNVFDFLAFQTAFGNGC